MSLKDVVPKNRLKFMEPAPERLANAYALGLIDGYETPANVRQCVYGFRFGLMVGEILQRDGEESAMEFIRKSIEAAKTATEGN